MKLVLLGTGGYYANDLRHTACYMLPEIGVVLDAGSAMYRVANHLATERLDIFLSHAHLDHVQGLTQLLGILPESVQQQSIVYGDPQKLDAIRTHLFSRELFPVKPAFQLLPLPDTVPLAGGGTLRHFPLTHPGGSIGYRLDWPGTSLAYVTDTIARDDAPYIESIRGVNLLMHEANFGDGSEEMAERTGHSCLSDVARVAAAAEVGLLVIVHVDPSFTDDAQIDVAAAKSIFPNTILGTDRMEIEF